jgi:ferritin-like metal-binding protein YciE
MTLSNLEDAFFAQLREALDFERKIARALPKMVKKAEHPDLKRALEEHLRQTEEQASRIEQVFDVLGEKARPRKCPGIEGIIEEGKEILGQRADPHVMDALIIEAAQKVEHYEIAAYGTLCTWAEELECDAKAIELLKQNLSEEKQADERLTRIAEEAVNPQAVAQV